VAWPLHLAAAMLDSAEAAPDCEVSDQHELVAASLLRAGSDTRAARLFKELSVPSGQKALATLAGALEADPGRRTAAVTDARAAAGRALDAANAGGMLVLAAGREGYPPLLSTIPDPPIVLWLAGRAHVLDLPSVALVGSRHASPNGLAIARMLARDLTRAGVVVVSGLAQGVDSAAHEGALEAGGPTIAVLGCGPDVVYPRQNRTLAARIRDVGCLLSEFPPGTPPLPRHFPLRNRIISGLSLAVVVIEAAERSGSLITARLALEQGRDVLAVPGGVVSGCHRGCHALIKDGAGLVESAEDVLAEIGWSPKQSGRAEPRHGIAAVMPRGEPIAVDALALRIAKPVNELLAELSELELAGRVARMPGGVFVRLD
jgi:DNA processing protein